MWKHNGREIRVGKSWTSDDGLKHPSNWAVWSDDEKAAFGLVWEDDPAPTKITVDLATQKANAIIGVKQRASEFLVKTDWQVIKATEVSDYNVPSDITTYRAAVRTASNNIETAINNAANEEAFHALTIVPVDSNGEATGNAPIDDWPDEV